jgi:hypothetical protein
LILPIVVQCFIELNGNHCGLLAGKGGGMPYASNNNAVLIDDCNNLQNLSVLLEVTEDIATTSGSGWILTKAALIARQGRVFDDTTVDDALKVLGQASGKLPPSMQGVGPAGATVIESLRGRTLEDGLKAASRTIRPRFQAPRR